MSAVNTAQGTPAPQTPTSSAARSGPGTAAQRKTGAEIGEDLFANLLTLMSDTRAAASTPLPAATSGSPDPADADAATNTTGLDAGALALLAGWPLEGRALANPATDIPRGSSAASAGSALSASTCAVSDATLPATATAATPIPSLVNEAGAHALPAGMTLTSESTPLDADTAAALARQGQSADAPASSAPAAPFMADRAGKAGAWPNAAVGGAGTNGSATTPSGWRKAASPAASDPRGIAVAGTATPVGDTAMLHSMPARASARSTVALHDRFGSLGSSSAGSDASAASEPASGSTVGWVSALSGATPGDARTASDSFAAGEAGTESRPAESSDPAATGTPDSAAERAAQASEAEARQVSHWSTQTLRHASLRVGQEGADAIDIRLSLAGQEVQVDFRTDDASARASLQQNASDSLAGLLQRSGIQLGGVSVGAQGPGQGLPQEQPGHDSRPGAGRSRAPAGASRLSPGGADSAPPIPVARPRADGSQGLDVFA